MQGGNARNLSTGEAGVFLAPVAALALLGLYRLRDNRLVRWLLILGLLAAPVPAVIKGAMFAIQRASSLLIYVSLLSGLGLATLAGSKRAGARAATAVYLPTNFYDVGAKWRFYTIKHDRRSLWARTRYFGDIAVLDAPPGSLALVPQAAATAAPPNGWSTAGVVENLLGETTAALLRRSP